jgi:hypothetical protein
MSAPIMQPRTVERLGDVEPAGRGLGVAQQGHIGVGRRLEQHQAQAQHKERGEDVVEAAQVHGRHKQKRAHGKEQQPRDHAHAGAQPPDEQAGRQRPQEVGHVHHHLDERRLRLAHVQDELVVLVEHVEYGPRAAPQEEERGDEDKRYHIFFGHQAGRTALVGLVFGRYFHA